MTRRVLVTTIHDTSPREVSEMNLMNQLLTLKTIYHVLFRLKIKINHINISIHVQKNKISYAGIQINDFFKYCSTEPNYRLFPGFSAVLPVWAWLSICDVISYKSDKVRPLDNVITRPFVS